MILSPKQPGLRLGGRHKRRQLENLPPAAGLMAIGRTPAAEPNKTAAAPNAIPNNRGIAVRRLGIDEHVT